MERRITYRRAMKQSLQRTIQAGAKGMRIRCAGRLDGAEIARKIIMHEGRVPLHTIRADIDYGLAEARTVMGRIGVKVWIYKGEILPEKANAEGTSTAPRTITAPVAEGESGADQAIPTIASLLSPEILANGLQAATEEPVSTAPSADEKPVTPVKRAPRARKVAVAEPKTEDTATEEKPARTVKRAPRAKATPSVDQTPARTEEKPVKSPAKKTVRTTTDQPKEAKSERKSSKPVVSSELAEKQGESDATT
jgi:hypothetical protein